MYLQPLRGNQGNMMRAAAQLRLHSPGERWTWECGGAGGSSLSCSAAWASSPEKEAGDMING